MKNLLIALLLVIFSFQGATVAIGGDGAGVAYAQQAAVVIDDAASAEADELNVSAAIEELSDYLPADLAFAQGLYPAPTRPEPAVRFLSVLLPATEPPPRA